MATISYENDQDKVKNFLATFTSILDDGTTVVKYKADLQSLADNEKTAMWIDLDDISDFDEELATNVVENTKRYLAIFSDTISSLLPDYRTKEHINKDILDVFIEHRILAEQAARGDDEVTPDTNNKYPPQLMRRFEIYFKASSKRVPLSVREIKSTSIGQLVTVKGIVTRCTDVKPMITVATYTCDKCGNEAYQPIISSTYVPLDRCPSVECRSNKSGGKLFFQTRASRFIKFQELKVQEHSDQVPAGNVPRSLTVITRGENTRSALPGDHIAVTGIFLPTLRTGFRALVGGLTSIGFIDAHRIVKMNKTDDDEITDDCMSRDEAIELASSDNFYNKLAESIAPEIYGHHNLKKALLLLLVGGVNTSPYGMKIRGAINICLMGDPGVAKSQLLSFIDRLAPRSQYTNGRGSSGVGLTASVMKDQVTGEMILEGGALVLADQGICCIDEFDKMLDADRTAIHEVMEQQTISIAKAGILTTLNARVSILAAANPVFGRYNSKKSVAQNIQLPAALLSRFDLLWLIQDKPDDGNDTRLASFVTYVHRNCAQPTPDTEPLEMKTMRRFIAACKKVNPIIPESLTDHIVNAYIEMRKEARNDKDMTFTSARSLLAIIRLSTALARLRLSETVTKGDIEEAIHLIIASKETLACDRDATLMDFSRGARGPDRIYKLIRGIFDERQTKEIPYEDAIDKCRTRGFSMDEIEEVLQEYEVLNVWQTDQDKANIILIN